MSLLTMKKLRFLIYQESASKTIEVIQKQASVELTEVPFKPGLFTKEKKVFNIDHMSSRVDLSINFLEKYAKKNFLKDLLEGNRTVTSEEEIEKVVHTFYYADIIKNTLNLKENTNNSNTKLKELEEEKEILKKWTGWNIPLSQEIQTKYTDTKFIQGKEKDILSLIEELEDYPHTHFQKCGEKTLSITHLHSDDKAIRKMIANYKLEITSLPKRQCTPTEEIEKISRAQKKALKNINEYNSQAEKLTEYLPKLKIISDYLNWKKEQLNTIYQNYNTKSCLVMEGWVPNNKINELEKSLKEKTGLCAIEEIPKEEINDEPPSEVQNPTWIEPFESVTRLYGLPSHINMDPSPYLAGFFFIFFGICLSDVGYGAILAGLTATTLYLYNLDRYTAGFIKLLMAGGIASIFAGFLFGGYFGIDTALLPEFMLYFQQFNPISDPLPIFYLALALGVIQLIFGMCLSIIRNAKNNQLTDGLIETAPWLMFFTTLGWWVAESFEYLPSSNDISLWGIYLSIGLIVLSKAQKTQGNIIKRLFSGVLGLYGSVQYLSDTLSYSRLLALGLATSALAYSINLIAGVVNETVPFIGWILMIVVLIIGHLFNMVVNILSSFIHTARLQFVEFFGKFITDTGRNFEPFRRHYRHTYIKESGNDNNG